MAPLSVSSVILLSQDYVTLILSVVILTPTHNDERDFANLELSAHHGYRSLKTTNGSNNNRETSSPVEYVTPAAVEVLRLESFLRNITHGISNPRLPTLFGLNRLSCLPCVGEVKKLTVRESAVLHVELIHVQSMILQSVVTHYALEDVTRQDQAIVLHAKISSIKEFVTKNVEEKDKDKSSYWSTKIEGASKMPSVSG